MVALAPYLHAQRFASRIRTLRQTYEEAHERLNQRRREAVREQNEHYHRANAGEEGTSVFDADGTYLHDKLDEYGFLIEDFGAMMSENRKGMAIQLYHLWERSVQSWTTHPSRPDHNGLVQMAAKVGAPGDLSRMEELRSVVNTLKHDNPARLDNLRQVRPDLIDEHFNAEIGTPRPYDRVALSHENIIEFFNLVLACGPGINTGEWPDILPAPVPPYSAWRQRDYEADCGVN